MISDSDLTIQTYRENFEKYALKTAVDPSGDFKEWLDLFASLLTNDAQVFEIGSATGRDARYLHAKGFQVTCADVIPEALQQLAAQGFETVEYDFRNDLDPEWIGNFEGVLANASLLHAPQPIFENALKNIALMLKAGGVFAFSLKTGEGEEITIEKMDAPRYFRYHSESEIRRILTGLFFEILFISHTQDGKWIHVVAKSSRERLELKA